MTGRALDHQVYEVAVPFPAKVVRKNPSGGGTYVPHHLYTQRLLLHFGRYDFELVTVLRGDVAGAPPNPQGTSARAKAGTPDLTNVVVGAVYRLRVVMDGETMTIEEVGDCEQPHNWTTDGQRMKDAASDALKRCCMRIGMGVHLYAKEPKDFILRDALHKKFEPNGTPEDEDEEVVVGGEERDVTPDDVSYES